MPPFTWNDTNDRKLLLQLLALHPIAVTGAEWDLIAHKWDRGNKGGAFRKHFDKIKARNLDEIDVTGAKMVKSGKSKVLKESGAKGLSCTSRI